MSDTNATVKDFVLFYRDYYGTDDSHEEAIYTASNSQFYSRELSKLGIKTKEIKIHRVVTGKIFFTIEKQIKAKRDSLGNLILDKDEEPVLENIFEYPDILENLEYRKWLQTGFSHSVPVAKSDSINNYWLCTKKELEDVLVITIETIDDFRKLLAYSKTLYFNTMGAIKLDEYCFEDGTPIKNIVCLNIEE